MISSHLMDEQYERIVQDYDSYRNRVIGETEKRR